MHELDFPISALLDDLAARLGPLFPRSETRAHAVREVAPFVAAQVIVQPSGEIGRAHV